jgi:hypothetical protein
MLHQVIGPRGGVTKADVSCYTCLCGTSCQLTRLKHLGCADWVNEDGQRVYFPEQEPGKIEVAGMDLPINPPGKTCDGCDKCGDIMDPPPVPLDKDGRP